MLPAPILPDEPRNPPGPRTEPPQRNAPSEADRAVSIRRYFVRRVSGSEVRPSTTKERCDAIHDDLPAGRREGPGIGTSTEPAGTGTDGEVHRRDGGSGDSAGHRWPLAELQGRAGSTLGR